MQTSFGQDYLDIIPADLSLREIARSHVQNSLSYAELYARAIRILTFSTIKIFKKNYIYGMLRSVYFYIF